MRGLAGRLTSPRLALAAVLVAFVALYLYLLRNVGIANDEWTFLLYRASGLQAVVLPYNNGPVVGEILLYRLWGQTVGVAHHWALSLVYALLQCAVVTLVYGIARRRLGAWSSLAVAVLALLPGRAWETILFPATLTFVLPTLAACAGWWALDRRPSAGAQVALGVLLAGAAVTGGLGPAVLLGLLAEVWLTRRWRWLWTLGAGAAALIAWYGAEWGNTDTHVATNLPHLPLWAAKYTVASAGAVFGLPPPGGFAVIALVAVLAWLRWRSPALERWWSPRAVGLLVTLAGAEATIGAARAADTPATSSRYLYFPAIVILLLGCELIRGLPAPRPRLAVAGAAIVVLVAAGLGIQQLRSGKVFYLERADGTAARMGALILGAGPPLVIEPSRLAYTPAVVASFIHRYGSAPIYSERQLATALPDSRAAADQVLAAADIRHAGTLRSCRQLTSGERLPWRNVDLAISTRKTISATLARFAAHGVGFAVRPPGTTFALARDQARRAWRLFFSADASARLCAFSRPIRTTF